MEESEWRNLLAPISVFAQRCFCVGRPDPLAFSVISAHCPSGFCHHQSVLLLCQDTQKERQRQGKGWLPLTSVPGWR